VTTSRRSSRVSCSCRSDRSTTARGTCVTPHHSVFLALHAAVCRVHRNSTTLTTSFAKRTYRCSAPAVWNSLLLLCLSLGQRNPSSSGLSLFPLLNSTLSSPSACEVTTYYGAIQTCLLLLEWATGACVKETQRRLLMHNVACLLHESRRTYSYLRYAQTPFLRFVLDSCTASPRQIEMTGV